MNFIKQLFTNNNNNDIDCPVCLDKITNDNYCKIPCGHTFHSTCIVRCNNKCPMCRTTICKDELETNISNLKEELNDLKILSDSQIDKYFIDFFLQCFDYNNYHNACFFRCIYNNSPIKFYEEKLGLNVNNHTVNYEIISVMDQLISIYLTEQEQNYIDSNLEHYMSLLNMS
jgi:hypothetical protein